MVEGTRMEGIYMIVGLLLMVAAYGTTKLVRLPHLYREWQAFQTWRMDTSAQAVEAHDQPPAPKAATPDPTSLNGAARALARPPASLQATLNWLKDHPITEGKQFAFPIGWFQGPDNHAALCRGAFVSDTNHILVSSMSDGGKDNLTLNILFTLALTHRPERLQVAIVDGKGLDFTGWRGKAHTWRLALKPDEIAPTMTALSAERERRRDILDQAGVSKWDNYRGGDLPLLVVYISELSLLEDAVGKNELTAWLNSELAAGRSFGMRYIIATQTASNFATRWRSQIGLYLAGFQPSDSQDTPNTGLTTKELESPQSVPPSKLPAPPTGAGIFTAVHGRDCLTVRTTLLTDEQRQAWLQRLPDAPMLVAEPQRLSDPAEATVNASQSSIGPLLPATTTTEIIPVTSPSEAMTQPVVVVSLAPPPPDVPPDKRDLIIELKRQGLSGNKIEEQVFGFSGGAAYRSVRKVLMWANLDQPATNAA